MSKSRVIWVFLTMLMLAGGRASATEANAVRLGWQIPWATQGQLVMGLRHSNIPELVDQSIEFIGFSYGGPLNKAALAGEVDVLLTADQPALVLISRNPDFRIVSRMMYNRVCIYVPRDSAVTKLSDLEGKVVMGPVGAAAERVALAGLAAAGVDVAALRTGSLDMAQQAALIGRSDDSTRWPGVDALYGFDPFPAVFEEQGHARMLDCGKVVSVVVATREMVEQRSAELERFLRAFQMSWHLYSREPDRLNRLFARESRLDVSNEVLDQAASVEPNRWSTRHQEQVFTLSDDDLIILEQAHSFLLERGIINDPVQIPGIIDTRIAETVYRSLRDEDLGAIRLATD